jgi:hypothetical protein
LVLKNLYFPGTDLLFPNSDFEQGTLANWTPEGNAFDHQPVFGDNSYAAGLGISRFVGNYWIGTFYNRHSPAGPAGSLQGDAPTGKLTSIAFRIKKNKISFLIGGGDFTDRESVSLAVDGKKVLLEKGKGSLISADTMRQVTWDVSQWKGKEAILEISDVSSGSWGHINADDFRYQGFLS